MMAGYHEYIASPAWRATRAQRLAIDGHKCRTCGHDGSIWRLQVHHISYARLGAEDVQQDLITLCSSCHSAITEAERRRRKARALAPAFEDLAA